MIKIKDLNVVAGGKIITRINPNMLDHQDCWDRLEEIKELHTVKHYLITEMMEAHKECMGKEVMNTYANRITECEYKLQEAWGFPRNAKFHKFWELPLCKCPKMDNEDRYPTGMYVYSGDCPIHGSE